MPLQLTATLILAASCAALSYFSFRRNRDATLAILLAVLLFAAFVAGSLLHPVQLTSKRTSHELSIAENVGAETGTAVPLDQQALDNLPNITLPAQGNIDFVAVRDGDKLAETRKPVLHGAEDVELRGWVADPVAGDAASGLFVIVNDSRRLDFSSQYGRGRPDVAAFLKNPRLVKTGFVVDVPASVLHPGTNELQLGVVASDQRGFFKFPDRVTVTLPEPKS